MRSAEAAGLETGLNRDEYDAPVARHIHWGRSRRRANAKDARLNERVRSKRVKAGRTLCTQGAERKRERERNASARSPSPAMWCVYFRACSRPTDTAPPNGPPTQAAPSCCSWLIHAARRLSLTVVAHVGSTDASATRDVELSNNLVLDVPRCP